MEVLALNFIVVSGAVLASSAVAVVEAKNFLLQLLLLAVLMSVL